MGPTVSEQVLPATLMKLLGLNVLCALECSELAKLKTNGAGFPVEVKPYLSQCSLYPNVRKFMCADPRDWKQFLMLLGGTS